MPKWTVKNGDCLDVLAKLSDASVDCIVTDPPYGLTSVDPKTPGGGKGSSGFMGKDWDKDVPPVKVWRECSRVLKPGAFAFILCSPRQDCLAKMIIRLEEAGFVTGFTSIYWVYASGFPKAQNLSKAADKRAGSKRKTVGEYTMPRDSTAPGKIPSQQVTGYGDYGGGGIGRPITAPATDEAKRLEGSYAGFQPKPAIEPVLVVMKPIEQKTYLDQALDNGKGCTWLDDCRIPIKPNDTSREDKNPHTSGGFIGGYGGATKTHEYQPGEGRFPANLVVSDDSLNDGTFNKNSYAVNTNKTAKNGHSDSYDITKNVSEGFKEGKGGSYSRYFDLDYWYSTRVGELPKEAQEVFPNLIVPKASG